MKKILYISSINPLEGPGKIALSHIKALKEGGYSVDFLTTFKVKTDPEIKFIYNEKAPIFHNFFFRLWHKIEKKDPENQFHFFYRKEKYPPVNIKKVLSKIQDDYDIVIIYFWQGLLSYKTVEAIYDKLNGKAKFVFFCADYSVMTGGCHFMGECKNYKVGCGRCPMISSNSPNDFTHYNVAERMRINTKIKPIIFTNSYMRSFFEQSPVIVPSVKLVKSTMTLDLNLFSPKDRLALLKKHHIDSDKYVMFFGCQSLTDERKGMSYLLESFNILHSMISEEERSKILVISAGNNSSLIADKIPFKQKHYGFINAETLSELYAMAHVFLSPSINDAGPSMVNQAIACGTPVVAFEMGTALDVIKDKGTGFCVELKNTRKFAEANYKLMHLDKKSYNLMRDNCRKVADENHSMQAFLNNFNSAISK